MTKKTKLRIESPIGRVTKVYGLYITPPAEILVDNKDLKEVKKNLEIRKIKYTIVKDENQKVTKQQTTKEAPITEVNKEVKTTADNENANNKKEIVNKQSEKKVNNQKKK